MKQSRAKISVIEEKDSESERRIIACITAPSRNTGDVIFDIMNTYYLVPSAEFQQTKTRGFDEITQGIVTNPQLDDYQRAVALQESLNKFLNMKPTYDKDKVKAVVKEVLADMKPSTPQPQQQTKPKYHAPMKILTNPGTFISPPPPQVSQQTTQHLDEGEDDYSNPPPPPKAASLKATQQLQSMSRTRGGAWISKN